MNPLVSIIVPVYNVEKYISYTLFSICNQTFRNFDIILIDDGSSDNSILIAESILNNSGVRFEIISQENKGVSSARNRGILKSSAEWVVCVDADDILHPDFLSNLIKPIYNNNCVVSICDHNRTSNELKVAKCLNNKSVYIFQKQILFDFLYRKTKIIVPAMLIKKSFLVEKALSFDESVRYSEDQIFIWNTLMNCDGVYFSKDKLYNYIIRANSIMTSSSFDAIWSGYSGVKKIENPSLISEEFFSLLIARWVFGTMRASSKVQNYESFRNLSLNIPYRIHFKVLIHDFRSLSVKIVSLLGLCSLKAFYLIAKNI